MSLKLFFAGAEVLTWKNLLISEAVERVGVNYLHLKPRLPLHKEWFLAEHFPADQEIFLDSGSFGINRKELTPDEHEAFLAEYLQFVQTNLDRLSYFTECDFLSMGQDWIEARRADTWSDLAPEKFVPIWHPEHGMPALRAMIGTYPNLGVPSLPKGAQNTLGPLIRSSKTALHGLSFNHPIAPQEGVYTSILSSSWISPSRYGETQVWDHNRLRRYPSEDKVKVRRRNRPQFISAGFNADKICGDDRDEVLRYTIWVWRQAERQQAGPQRVRYIRRPDRPPMVTIEANGHVPEDAPILEEHPVIDPEPIPRNGSRLPAVIKPLPVFEFRPVTSTVPDPDGGTGTIEMATPVAIMGRETIRSCNSCSLAGVCPEFEVGSACKFSIPVEIRTRPQLMGILHSLLEMQAQRIGFGFFSEQLQGAYPDANLSVELDRFMKMTQSVKDIEDNRDFFKLTVEGKGEAGVLRKLFGGDRLDNLHRVDAGRAEQAIRKTFES